MLHRVVDCDCEGGVERMLVDSLTFQMEKSGCVETFWGKLDRGLDATLAVASSARPFMTAVRFAHKPQPTLVVVAGEDAAVAFARNVAAFIGEERVLRFPERKDYPFAPKRPDARVVAQRMQAAHALTSGRDVVVVASARALVRCLPPASANVQAPIPLHVGDDLADGAVEGVEEFGDLTRALEERGYANTGNLTDRERSPFAAASSTCSGQPRVSRAGGFLRG